MDNLTGISTLILFFSLHLSVSLCLCSQRITCPSPAAFWTENRLTGSQIGLSCEAVPSLTVHNEQPQLEQLHVWQTINHCLIFTFPPNLLKCSVQSRMWIFTTVYVYKIYERSVKYLFYEVTLELMGHNKWYN